MSGIIGRKFIQVKFQNIPLDPRAEKNMDIIEEVEALKQFLKWVLLIECKNISAKIYESLRK